MYASRIAALALVAALAQASVATAQQPAAPSGPGGVAVPQPIQPKQFPTGVTFEAVSLNGRPIEGDRPAMTLDQTFRMRGFSGCNNYSATAYPLRDQGFAVGPFALTRRECDAGATAKERSFLEALRSAQKWDVNGSTLLVTGAQGEIRFERAL